VTDLKPIKRAIPPEANLKKKTKRTQAHPARWHFLSDMIAETEAIIEQKRLDCYVETIPRLRDESGFLVRIS